MRGCGDSVGYLAMGPQPSVVHLVGWCADLSRLLALDNQHPPVVDIGGISEKSRPGSRRQNKDQEEEENTRPGSRKMKKK